MPIVYACMLCVQAYMLEKKCFNPQITTMSITLFFKDHVVGVRLKVSSTKTLNETEIEEKILKPVSTVVQYCTQHCTHCQLFKRWLLVNNSDFGEIT